MPRKKWVPQTEITPSLLKFREKKKWQIALRRYIIKKQSCVPYAPYFGLDIKNMRKWVEMQFENGVDWEGFGKTWQLDHIIPVTYFDFTDEEELKLCWNFTNIRVELLSNNHDGRQRVDVFAAKNFFKTLYESTQYLPCLKILQKINKLEHTETHRSEKQRTFIVQNRLYLEMIESYSSFEFELINSGRSIEEVNKEVNFLKKF